MPFIHTTFFFPIIRRCACIMNIKNEPILDFHNHLLPEEIAMTEIWKPRELARSRSLQMGAMRANGTPRTVTGPDPKEKYLAGATLPIHWVIPYHWTSGA